MTKVEYIKAKLDAGFATSRECPEEDAAKYAELMKAGKELPSNIYYESKFNDDVNNPRVHNFFEILETHSDNEKYAEYLMAVQTTKLTSIHKWVTFFGVLTVVGMGIGVISILVTLFG